MTAVVLLGGDGSVVSSAVTPAPRPSTPDLELVYLGNLATIAATTGLALELETELLRLVLVESKLDAAVVLGTPSLFARQVRAWARPDATRHPHARARARGGRPC